MGKSFEQIKMKIQNSNSGFQSTNRAEVHDIEVQQICKCQPTNVATTIRLKLRDLMRLVPACNLFSYNVCEGFLRLYCL